MLRYLRALRRLLSLVFKGDEVRIVSLRLRYQRPVVGARVPVLFRVRGAWWLRLTPGPGEVDPALGRIAVVFWRPVSKLRLTAWGLHARVRRALNVSCLVPPNRERVPMPVLGSLDLPSTSRSEFRHLQHPVPKAAATLRHVSVRLHPVGAPVRQPVARG